LPPHRYADEVNHEALVADLGNGGNVVAMVLARVDAVAEWQHKLGPVDPDEAMLHPEWCVLAPITQPIVFLFF
jgi:hypothetical protein